MTGIIDKTVDFAVERVNKLLVDFSDSFPDSQSTDYVYKPLTHASWTEGFWTDMIFTNGDEPRDTSAAAIAICGIMEMNKYFSNKLYEDKSREMMTSLCRKYLTDDKSNGILKDAMYRRPEGDKSECNIWGDYFFMEALMRFKDPDRKIYW